MSELICWSGFDEVQVPPRCDCGLCRSTVDSIWSTEFQLLLV